jgi:predicted HicB family RNase H-like nuclease
VSETQSKKVSPGYNVRISPELYLKLREAAAVREGNRKITRFINEILAEYVERNGL